jgi:uncharacterized protein
MELTLEHQALLEPRFRRLALDLCDYNFANLYLFRKVHAFELVERGDLYVRGKTRDGQPYLMPTRGIQEIDWEDLQACLGEHEILFPIPEEWLSAFDPERFEWSRADQDDDYLYHSDKLGHYPGRKLSSRRNLVHQFLDKYPSHLSFPLRAERASHALQVLEEWQRHPHGDPSYTDYEECREAIQLIDRLHLFGKIIYVEGVPAAFALGEPLNPKTYVIHSAKAVTAYKGIYQYLFEDFAQSVEKEYEWINLEQDLGSEDIRHSKRSYQPDRLIPKWRVKRKRTADF